MRLYKNRYFYFVSYSHQHGFGTIQINLDEPKIESIEQVTNVSNYISENFNGGKDVCILNFKLLRTEKIWFWHKEKE